MFTFETEKNLLNTIDRDISFRTHVLSFRTMEERYRVQLDLYGRALERISGKRVKEKFVYLFYSGEEIRY